MKENWFTKHKVLTAILVLIIIGIIYGGGDKKSSTYQSEKTIDNSVSITATPTVVAGKVEVKSEKKKIDIGYTKIVGEVINNTEKPVENVKITATFYDADGEVIATNFTYAGDTTNTPLEKGKTTPFEVSSYPDKINADSYKLDVTWR